METFSLAERELVCHVSPIVSCECGFHTQIKPEVGYILIISPAPTTFLHPGHSVLYQKIGGVWGRRVLVVLIFAGDKIFNSTSGARKLKSYLQKHLSLLGAEIPLSSHGATAGSIRHSRTLCIWPNLLCTWYFQKQKMDNPDCDVLPPANKLGLGEWRHSSCTSAGCSPGPGRQAPSHLGQTFRGL